MSRVNKKSIILDKWEDEDYLGSARLTPALKELIKVNTLKSKSSKNLTSRKNRDNKNNLNLYSDIIDSTSEISMFV